MGTFQSSVPGAKWFAVLGATGVILSAVYLLWMLQRVVFGEVTKEENARLEDLDWRETAGLVPMVVLAVVMGVAPMYFLDKTEKSVNLIRGYVGTKIAQASK